MELEKIGTLRIDNDKLRSSFPGMRPGISAAVSDISLANTLNVGPAVPAVNRFGRHRAGPPLAASRLSGAFDLRDLAHG